MLGDTAVAVHPDDERYRRLVGRNAILPLVGRRIPIIADEYSDPEKGTGAVKITPAHDFNDFEVGRLPRAAADQRARRRGQSRSRRTTRRSCATSPPSPELEETLTYHGLDRFVVRKEIVARMEAAGLLAKIEPHLAHGAARRPLRRRDRAVPDRAVVRRRQEAGAAGDRGGARRAHRVRAAQLGSDLFQLDGKHPALVHLAPALVGAPNSGLVWLQGGRGGQAAHRRQPAIKAAVTIFVAESEAEAHRAGAQVLRRGRRGRGRSTTARPSSKVYAPQGATRPSKFAIWRDEDVLDTWFSSALWPFSTLGWPDETKELKRYYPTDALVTGIRHHLLLGRAHDDDGPAVHGGGAVPHRLHPRAGARRARRQDVEVEGQRHRPARSDRRIRRRCAALHAGRHGGAGPRHQARHPARRAATATLRPSSGTPAASPR